MPGRKGRAHRDDDENEAAVVARSGLNEILKACTEACEQRQAAAPGNAEWYKSSGQIIAFGKLSFILQTLIERLEKLGAH